MAQVGANLRIVSITPCAPDTRRKLLDIGLNPGSQITLTNRAQGVAIISRSGSRCALSLTLAHQILVEPAKLASRGDFK